MLWCCEQIWFDRIDTLHVIMYKLEHCWGKDNNYTEKPVTKRLSQTTLLMTFLIFMRSWQVVRQCTLSSNINQSIN